MAKKNNWVELGTLRSKNVEGKGRVSWIILNKDVEVLVNGQRVELGKYRQVKLTEPSKSLEALLAGGYINEDQLNQKKDKFKELNVVYKLAVPPAQD